MADQPRPDELAELRADLAALRARVDRPRRRFLPLALVALLVALLPLSLLAADPTFSDLGDAAEVHRANIQAIGNAGITTGFEDPSNPSARLYNPKGQVTREEMASFLARTAGLGTNPPVASAKTAQTADAATDATNATQLNGQPASFYQPAGQPIANATNAQNAGNAGNANTVGGYAPSGLVRVAQTARQGGIEYLPSAFNPLTSVTIDAPGPGFVLATATLETYGNPNGFLAARLRHGAANTSPTLTTMLPTAGTEIVVPVQYIFPVVAGSQTITIEAYKGDNTAIYGYVLTALFVPFGHDGGTTLAPTP